MKKIITRKITLIKRTSSRNRMQELDSRYLFVRNIVPGTRKVTSVFWLIIESIPKIYIYLMDIQVINLSS